MSLRNDERLTSPDCDDIFKDQIEKDDPLWKTYIDETNLFDKGMIEEWNKIIDVILVFVALFISVLTAFVVNTSTQFQRDPSAITNDILIAIYKQLAAQSNNTSAPFIDPATFFIQDKTEHKNAVFFNALLYCSLALSIVVATVALVAKLWLVNYSHQVFSVGSPYERAMRRQEAYNGVLVWNLNATINALPIALITALVMFAIFITVSVRKNQGRISTIVGAILVIGLVGLAVVSIAAAFVPSCPYRSSVADAVELLFTTIERLLKLTRCDRLPPKQYQWLRAVLLGSLCIVLGVWTPIFTLRISTTYYSLVCFPIMITYAVVMKKRWGNHKAQHYRLPRVIGLSYLIIVPIITVSGIFCNRRESPIFFGLYGIGAFLFIFSSIIVFRVSKSMEATGEIDAISWLLKSTSSQYSSLFKKAGQIASKPGFSDYNARFLVSLLPLLSPLITSEHADNLPHSEDLEIYVGCLARMSNFTDYGGSFWLLNEDARSHPPLDDPLRAKLVKFATSHRPRLRTSALEVLHNYGLDDRGEKRSIPNESSLHMSPVSPDEMKRDSKRKDRTHTAVYDV